MFVVSRRIVLCFQSFCAALLEAGLLEVIEPVALGQYILGASRVFFYFYFNARMRLLQLLLSRLFFWFGLKL